MKKAFFSLSSLSVFTLLTLASSSIAPVSAQCVLADVAVQASINGSGQPAQQTNDVDLQSTGPCTGNSIVNTGVQVDAGGTNDVIQKRTSSQSLSGGTGNGTGINGPTVKIPVSVQVDVDNPASRLSY